MKKVGLIALSLVLGVFAAQNNALAEELIDSSYARSLHGADVKPVLDSAYGQYMKDICSKISDNWELPLAAKNVSITVNFSEKRDGILLGANIIKSCGNPELDETALKAVYDSLPFEAFPEASAERLINVSLELERGNK